MDWMDWVPSIVITSAFAGLLWVLRSAIGTSLNRAIEFKFNQKLEAARADAEQNVERLKADLRSKESEISSIRNSVLSAMSNRQTALDQRRLEAVDQLWSAVTELAPAKSLMKLMGGLNYEKVSKDVVNSPPLRQFFEQIGSGFATGQIDFRDSERARPFVSPMAWALFSAYRAMAGLSVAKLQALKMGIDARGLIDKTSINGLIKVALPEREGIVDRFGESAYPGLLEEIEARLLRELRNILEGVESDMATIGQAAEIVKRSNDLVEAAEKSGLGTPHAG